MEMINFDKLFDLAKKSGIEDIQISYSSETSLTISYDDLELTKYEKNTNTYLGAKGIYNGKMGSYATEKIADTEIETIINKVIESAKHITNTDEVFIYEGDKEYKKIKNEYNESLSKVPMKEKLELCDRTSSKLNKLPYLTHSSVEYSETEEVGMMINSKGLNLKTHGNYFVLYAQAVVSKDDDTRTNYEGFGSNDFTKINEDKLIDTAYKNAYNSIGASPVKSNNYEAIFSEDASATILSCFSGMFSSDAMQKDLSLLKGRVGEKIGSDACTIVDDPFLEDSPNQASFDSDGVATSYKEVVKNGVFTGFLYNLKTAKKDNTKSTGNARGSGCSFINAYFKPGKRTKDEMIKDIKNGLYITDLMGAHSGTNALSGDFSLQAKGFVIENGTLTKPVALITVSSNFLEFLKSIEEVSSEITNLTDCTALKIKSISVSGL